jgi:mono/diheme cytochrome c family protein
MKADVFADRMKVVGNSFTPPSPNERRLLTDPPPARHVPGQSQNHPRRTSVRYSLLIVPLLLFAGAAGAQSKATNSQDSIPANFVPTGKEMFKQYCAACHGLDAKGHGPARAALKIPAADLTTLAKRHRGEFPTDLVTNVLRFGPGVAAHGSSDMPTWGGIFNYMDNYNQGVVQKRIKNLCDYLVSLQEK